MQTSTANDIDTDEKRRRNYQRTFPNIGTIKPDRVALIFGNGTIVTNEQRLVAENYISRGEAFILERGALALAEETVICRRQTKVALKPGNSIIHFAGEPVRVIDPGENTSVFVCKDEKCSLKTIPKSCCRKVGKCLDSSNDCGNCCNRKKK